jgi:3',5'-cyclic-nucleotide phosphodiesterase
MGNNTSTTTDHECYSPDDRGLTSSPSLRFSRIKSMTPVGSKVNNWNIDPFKCNDARLFEFLVSMFDQLGLLERFTIEKSKFIKFLESIRNSYHSSNPFHNFQHAFAVTHTCYRIINSGAGEVLEDIDVLGCLIAALCHDLDHPGNTK